MQNRDLTCFNPVPEAAAWCRYLLPERVNQAILRGLFTKIVSLGTELMKAEIHPKYEEITITCSCGNAIRTRSTLCDDLQIEVCSKCHPFFTGKQKIVDAGGRVDRFRRKYGKSN